MADALREMPPLAWSTFDKQTVRRVGLHLAREALTLNAYDVRRPDPRRNLLLAERDGRSLEIHVRTVRNLNYAFWPKAGFRPDARRFACLVRLPEGAPPEVYLVPSRAWEAPDKLLVAPDYEGLASAPEFGLRLAPGRLLELAAYRIDRVAPFADAAA